ncbi:MAG: hypothetical protein H7X95_10805 [Deltaproteobacteria bacterium]|nr:hypothetical protein [Deltaproteobacteria bacterium]
MAFAGLMLSSVALLLGCGGSAPTGTGSLGTGGEGRGGGAGSWMSGTGGVAPGTGGAPAMGGTGGNTGSGGSFTIDGSATGGSNGTVDASVDVASDGGGATVDAATDATNVVDTSDGAIAPARDGAVDGFVTTPPDAGPDAAAVDAIATRDAANVDGLDGLDGATPAPTGPGMWLAGTPIPSLARQEVGVAAIGDAVYVIGGYSRLVDAFDTKTGQWRSVAPLPTALDHPNVAAVAGKIYLLGATQAGATVAGDVNTFLVYDGALNQWSRVRPMPVGTDRAGSGVAVIGSKIYIVGGWKSYGNATANVSSYDTATDTWETLPDIVPRRDHLVAGAVAGIVYAIGGRNGTIGTPMGRVDAFDPIARSWSTRAPMITPRGGTAAAVVFNRIYVFGGEGNTAAGSNGVFSQTEVYDPVMNAWRALAPMIVPKHGIGAAAVGAKIYLPGGATRQGGNGQVASMEIFSP